MINGDLLSWGQVLCFEDSNSVLDGGRDLGWSWALVLLSVLTCSALRWVHNSARSSVEGTVGLAPT